jgi:hypothetical protein
MAKRRNWDKINKEQQDLRQRRMEEARLYENSFILRSHYRPIKPPSATSSTSEVSPVEKQSDLHKQNSILNSSDGKIPCQYCPARLNPKNLKRHIRKTHQRLTNVEVETLDSIRRLTKLEQEVVLDMRGKMFDLRNQKLSQVEKETLESIFGDVPDIEEHQGLTIRQKEILRVLFGNHAVDPERVERENRELEFGRFVEDSLEKLKPSSILLSDLFSMNQWMGANDYIVGALLLYLSDFLNLVDRVAKYINGEEDLTSTDTQEIVALFKDRAKATKTGLKKITSKAPWN